MHKRIQALLLTVLMVGTLAIPAMADNPFQDVPADHWAYDAVSYLANAGLVEGYPDGTFGGSRNFTRYEMALVFARILARLENHIDESVEAGIDSRLEELSEQVSEALEKAAHALAAAEDAQDVAIGTLDGIDARDWDSKIEEALEAAQKGSAEIDEERLAELERQVEEALALARAIESGEVVPSAGYPEGDIVFSDEARAAIEEIAAEVVADKLQSLEEYADRLAAEVADLQGDRDIARKLIEAETDEMANALSALTREFNEELSLLGVRVTQLEAKFAALEQDVAQQGDEIQAIRADLDRIKISGRNETRFTVGSQSGSTPVLSDPRDPDSDEFEVYNETGNRLVLDVEARPYDDVQINAQGDFIIGNWHKSNPSSHLWLQQNLANQPQIRLGTRAWVEAITDKALRTLRIGSLDEQRIAEDYASFLLHDEELEERTNLGVFANVVADNAEASLFSAGRRTQGVSGRISLGSAMELSAGALQHHEGSTRYTGYTLGASGELPSFSYDATTTRDNVNDAWAYSVNADVPGDSLALNFRYESIDEVWSTANRMPLSEEVEKQDPDKADKVIDINKPIFADQRLLKARADAPIGPLTAFAQLGTYESEMSANVSDSFTQFGIYDLDLFGIDVEATQSNFLDEYDADKVLRDRRIRLSTTLETADLGLQLHKQENDQVPVTDPENDQNHFLASLEVPVEILIPWNLTAHYGISFTADHNEHTAFKLAFEDYEVSSDIFLDAEISSENNVIEDGKWRKNANWTGENETVRGVGATWQVNDPFALSAGYKVANHTTDGRTVTQDLGAEYVLGAFGGDLAFGYGYRVVHNEGVMDGEPRNTIRAQFDRTVGDFTVQAKAKRVLGGTVDEDGNDVDTTADLKLLYPVFTGADFLLDGKYVSSSGSKGPSYKASRVTAGLNFVF